MCTKNSLLSRRTAPPEDRMRNEQRTPSEHVCTYTHVDTHRKKVGKNRERREHRVSLAFAWLFCSELPQLLVEGVLSCCCCCSRSSSCSSSSLLVLVLLFYLLILVLAMLSLPSLQPRSGRFLSPASLPLFLSLPSDGCCSHKPSGGCLVVVVVSSPP